MTFESETCRICRKRKADSPEHFIPRAVGNKGEVKLLTQGTDGLTVLRETGGFAVRVLCRKCNTELGSVYAQQYTLVSRAISETSGLVSPTGNTLVTVDRLFQLRFVKHLFLMYLAAAPWHPHVLWKPLCEFVSIRDSKLPRTAPHVFLYHNTSQLGRIVPACGMVEFATHRTTVLAEVSWPPLGVLFLHSQHPVSQQMFDVTSWGHLDDTPCANVTLELPRKQISAIYPVAFGDEQSVKRQQQEMLPAYLGYVPPESKNPIVISALIQAA